MDESKHAFHDMLEAVNQASICLWNPIVWIKIVKKAIVELILELNDNHVENIEYVDKSKGIERRSRVLRTFLIYSSSL